jgi:hypothetical protein
VRWRSSRYGVQIVTLGLAALTCSGLWLDASPARARGADGLRGCVERAVADAKQRGARVETEARTDFLLTGDARVHVHRYSTRSCLGFVAAGAKFTQAIDLTVLAPSGRVLARGAPRTTLPHAMPCGEPGDVAFVSVRMTDGQGEVTYAALTDARPTLNELTRCAALGAPRPAALELGPEPTARPLEDELAALGSELAESGYTPDGLVAFGALLAGQHEARMIALDPQRCYALAAIGDSDVVDLDLRVFAQGAAPEPLTADTSRRRNALVKLCTDQRTRYVLDTAVFQGDGGYVVQAFRLALPVHAPGVDGQARLSFGEQSARMLARGFQAEPMTTGLVAPNERLRVPLQVRAGRCYAFGAVALADSPRGALDLGVLDAQGRLVALDTGGDEDPLAFHCAREDGTISVLVRAKDTRGSARFALLVGREPDSEPREELP